MTNILDDSYESDLTEEESIQLLMLCGHAIGPSLSPVARAVFEAFNSKFDWIEDGMPGPQFNAIAAALRAAADQLGEEMAFYNERLVSVTDLLAIATELEAQ